MPLAALALGLVFSAGDGVDTNAFFDLAIACCLARGPGEWNTAASPCWLPLCAAPLPLFLAFAFP